MTRQEVRIGLTNLEKKFNYEENRFGDVQRTIGRVQSEGLYPSIVGFERSLLHVLLKVILPVTFAAILVFIDTVWIAVCSLLLLLVCYFVLQQFFVKANISRRELLNCGLFILVGYVSVFLFISIGQIERNYFGWFYIVILTVYISFTGIGQLQKAIKTLKKVLIGTE